MSDEHISREAAIDDLTHTLFYDQRDKATAKKVIATLPAADVKPVVRGEWQERVGEYPDGNVVVADWYCSVCGEHGYNDFNFCPNCGADMRKEVNDER